LAGLFGCAAPETSAAVQGYRSGPGDREISVVYLQGPDDPADRVDHLPVVTPPAALDRLGRRQRRQHSPFLVRQITACHTGSNDRRP
jgi:hypothetical protein